MTALKLPGFVTSEVSKRNFVALFTLLISIVWTLNAGLPALAQSNQSAKPRLVVLLVADQFSFSFLERYKDKLSQGGFRYLLENGASFTNCKLECATTHKACGHSVIATGAYPWSTGVVADAWYSRKKQGLRGAVEDDSSNMTGANGRCGGLSFVYGTTVGDQLKLATNGRAKVYCASVDQMSSLLLAGTLASRAFWFDEKTGNMVSSSKYGSTLPGWAKAFNDQHTADRYIGKPWQRLMPETQYGASTSDSYPRERVMEGDGRRFPHIVQRGQDAGTSGYYSNFAMTPWANQLIMDFGKSIVEKERLGQHSDSDLLVLGLTAGEKLTQYFGPNSQETQDLVLRMDRSLESFLQFVEDKVGLKNTMIVFTASHGSPSIPEFLGEKGMTAGRIDPNSFVSFLDSKLDSQIGDEDWISEFAPPNLYLNFEAIDKQKLRQPDVESLVSRIARSIPGIGEIFAAAQLYTNATPNSRYTTAVRKSYYFGRSGELYILPKPGFIFSDQSDGTGFGSPYSYDTHVPLILCGPGIKQGKFGQTSSPADVSATIAGSLNTEVPTLCEGRALQEAFLQVAGPPLPRVKPPVSEAPKSGDKKRR